MKTGVMFQRQPEVVRLRPWGKTEVGDGLQDVPRAVGPSPWGGVLAVSPKEAGPLERSGDRIACMTL